MVYTSDQPSVPKKRKRSLSPLQKLESILHHIQSLDWSYGDYLFYSSEWRHFARGNAHSIAVEKFLSGRCQHHPGEIIRNWYSSPDGRLGDDNLTSSQMWCTSEPKYHDIKHVRACLTSFAAQICIEHAVHQAKLAVKPESGLHVRLSVKGSSGSLKSHVHTDWADIGADTVSRVGKIFRTHEPFLYSFLACVASGNTVFDETVTRKTRPIDMVVTHSIASLNFSLNRRANWLPVARGILYFSTSAPVDLFAYESRTGTMPAYSTVYEILRELGEKEGAATRAAGADPKRWGKIVFDNTQRNLRQRDMRAGRENKMSVGIAATFIEYAEGTFPPGVHDVDDKKARIAKNERAHIGIDFFVDLLNDEHLETVGAIQWLESLVTQIPELAHLEEHVAGLYKTRGAINPLPPQPSNLHCLSTVAKNENVTAELYSALLNFLAQTGQTADSFGPRVLPVGGDGLSYQRLLELKRYLQYDENDLLSLSFVEPQLEWWHTMWTDLNRLYETHWGEPLSQDPSTLGHSSRKIGRDDPPNLKKIDYYPGIQLAYLILDTRMLDCWRLAFNTSDIFEYFRDLSQKDELPTIEVLEDMAQTLFQNYSTTRAYYHALHDAGASKEMSSWTGSVPVGTAWTGPADSDKKAKKPTRKQKEMDEEKQAMRTTGDRVLANSISFMRDALLSRECANAVASGDVGRVWEVLKVMLFTFAGSSHSKYTTYLLETITSLELESSRPLRDALLRTMLINLNGKPGAFFPCDIIQEYFNRLLEFIVERKGKEFDHAFIQQIISRNLHRMSQAKIDARASVGLARHAGRHSEPHSNPEVRILLRQYAHHELHSRRAGRYVEERDTDNFMKGWIKLENGKLAKWVQETTSARVRQDVDARNAHTPDPSLTDSPHIHVSNGVDSPATITPDALDSDHFIAVDSEGDSDEADSDSDDEDIRFGNMFDFDDDTSLLAALNLGHTTDENTFEEFWAEVRVLVPQNCPILIPAIRNNHVYSSR
ncbi:hypothetical protein C8R42DRAFT_573424 [Lentinula raphanica]|nr:hypothetical protein C8R42DRAFT_573424 [Lentinula raphanica]